MRPKVNLKDWGPQQIEKIQREYADSLKLFTDSLNQKFKTNNVSPDKVVGVEKNK